MRRTFGSNRFCTGSKSMMQPRSASTHSKINSMMRLSNWSMSSVWLTASAVRYITWRLLLARASHESCGKSAWRSKTRLPSSWETERMIRDWSSGVGGGDVDRLGQVFAAAGGAGVEHERPADLNLVAAGQAMGVDLLAVDERAVGAVQIGDAEIAVAAAHLGVMAGDLGVVNLEDVRGVAPQPENGVLQLESRALIVSANDEQRCHAPNSPANSKVPLSLRERPTFGWCPGVRGIFASRRPADPAFSLTPLTPALSQRERGTALAHLVAICKSPTLTATAH